mgnify:FL=1
MTSSRTLKFAKISVDIATLGTLIAVVVERPKQLLPLTIVEEWYRGCHQHVARPVSAHLLRPSIPTFDQQDRELEIEILKYKKTRYIED